MKRDKGKRVGYGCYYGTEKRKAYRQCRKNFARYGVAFDDSETWSLGLSFIEFCLDQGVLKKSKCWTRAYKSLYFYEEISEADKHDMLDDLNSYQNVDLLVSWLVPRLDRFLKLTNGYPCDMTYDSWRAYIRATIEEVRVGKFDLFVKKISNFWW